MGLRIRNWKLGIWNSALHRIFIKGFEFAVLGKFQSVKESTILGPNS